MAKKFIDDSKTENMVNKAWENYQKAQKAKKVVKKPAAKKKKK